MPFDESQIRLERLQVETLYHAAYTFWNLRGLLAERWAHGPIFGATADSPQQVTLTPASDETDDARLQAIYGIRASAINAEGVTRVAQAQEVVDDWFRDVYEVLKPKRVVRNVVRLFGLYPVDDAVEVSRRLREHYYSGDDLEKVLPPSLRGERDRYHSAVNFFIPFAGNTGAVSVIVGTVGPPHEAGFFTQADSERDAAWWLGIQYEHRHSVRAGIPNPRDDISKIVKRAMDDYRHTFSAVLREVVG